MIFSPFYRAVAGIMVSFCRYGAQINCRSLTKLYVAAVR